MTWIAPDVERTDAPRTGDERTILEGYLDYHRQTLLWKCSGMDAGQLKTATAPPSKLTLLGLVRHMADVERWWFRTRASGEEITARFSSDESPDGDFDDLADADPAADFAAFEEECRASRAAAAVLSLEHTFPNLRTGAPISLRWVYVHMIEEYARHNGHADLIRERIDGATGD
jgi:hypothetical protein